MKKNLFKPLLLSSAIIFALSGCSSSDSDSDNTGGSGGSGGSGGAITEITGSASAPSGAVASFQSADQSTLLAISNFIFSPAIAAITGLQRVTGATVELIEVDDSGTQIGAVIATTATSITGSYTLTIPSGVTLSGNLIVRISGSGSAKMRAQVVEQEIDITPVSEFVLQKFIDEGTDLDQLTTASVVKLSGEVEEFDLSASNDLSTMLAALETEVGAFVDEQIADIDSSAGDVASIVGNYRLTDLFLGLHDSDGQGVGTYSIDSAVVQLAFADAGSGAVNITTSAEEDAYTNHTFFDNSGSISVDLSYDVGIENGINETETAQYNSKLSLSIDGEFEEDIDGDYGWRFPSASFQFQKARNTSVFIGINDEAGVRYSTVDTNDDGIKDAIDPAQREGDEVFKSLSIVAKKASNLSVADISGTFGYIDMYIELDASGSASTSVEERQITFDGTTLFSASESSGNAFQRSLTGSAVNHSYDVEEAETGLAIAISADGDISTFGEDTDGFFNEAGNFFVLNGSNFDDDANPDDSNVNEVEYNLSLGIKLPVSTVNLSNKQYKVLLLAQEWTQNGTAMISTGSSSNLTIASNGSSATARLHIREMEKTSLTGEVAAEAEIVDITDITITESDSRPGKLTLTLTPPDGDGVLTAEGFISADGSIGIFRTKSVDTGETNPAEIGVMVLLEITTTQ